MIFVVVVVFNFYGGFKKNNQSLSPEGLFRG